MRILFAEDEKSLNRLVRKMLESAGYAVDACLDGDEAWSFLQGRPPYDAVILDVMMPGVDGLTLLERMRAEGNRTPVLLLTARDALADRVRGLDAGADDYLTKPFASEELLARVRALIRRGPAQQGTLLQLGNLTLDPATRRVRRGEREIALSAREFALLEYLMRNPGLVLSRRQIEDHVWNYDYEGGSNIVDVYIRYLRDKIDAGEDRPLIHTVRGVGYVLREEP